MELNTTLHYCKADKHTGKPIIVTDMTKKTRKNRKRWSMKLKDENDNPVELRMSFRNSKGKAKRQGATTVLEIWK